MGIDNDALLAAIDDAKERAYGTDEISSLGDSRTRSIEYYLGLNTNPAPEGRSQVVDRSVYETIQVMLPSLVRIFASSSETVCKVLPIGPDDEPAAEQTTAVLNNIVTEQNQWEQICADWLHDAMLLPNGYAMAYWEESESLVREVYEGQSDEQVAALMQDDAITVLQHSESIDEQATKDAQRAYEQAMQQYQMMLQQVPPGMPPPPPPPAPQPVLEHELVIERKEREGKICIKVLPPEHCRVSADTPDWTLNECPYFEYRQQKTIAELRAMGLDVPFDIADDEDEDTDEDFARDRFGEDRDLENSKGLMRRVWARMVWIRADVEGDEQARLYYAIVVGRTVLYVEPCARIPVASMVSQALPHRHPGLPVAETVTDIQDIRTAVTRGALDNLYLANNGRHVVSSRVNVDDLLESRPGGVVRMLDDSLPGEGHVLPLVHPYAFDTIVGSLEYFDQVRQNRTGASRYFSGTDAGAINKTAAGTGMLQNAASQRVEHIARMMAPAVEALFSAVHEILQKHRNKAMALKLRGEWTMVDPQAWRTKRDVRISVGVGAGNKESMMAQLAAIFGAQMQLIPLQLAGPEQIHATVVEMAKLSGFANPDKFWIAPKPGQPLPPPPNPDAAKIQGQMQIKQMELQADAQKFQAETMNKMREIQMENERKMAELQANLTVQATNDARDSEREQAKAVIEGQIKAQELEHQRQLEELRLGLEKYKAELDAQTKLAVADKSAPPAIDLAPIQKALDDLMGSKPVGVERLRGEGGRLIGVRKRLANGKTEDVMIQ